MKYGKIGAGCLAVVLCLGTMPVTAWAGTPEFAYTAEQWASLRDNQLDFTEIADLIHVYNNTVIQNSIVSVHYKGTLINGREFDNSWKRNCPEAFRLNEVIDGWQIALQQMRVGDHWMVYIPYTVGYGTRTSGPIPAFSTLIFEVKLLGIA